MLGLPHGTGQAGATTALMGRKDMKMSASSSKTPAKKAESKTAKSVTATSYRQVDGFQQAVKSARSLAKGNPDLSLPLALITHLAWKTPTASVGWAAGTTASVVAYADDIAVPVGTPIVDAMQAALKAATAAASEKPQQDAVEVVAKLVQAHSA